MIAGKKILVGICGGIAAYKICYLIRELIKQGCEVKIMMTPQATQFITPLTLSTLSGNEVYVNMFPESKDSNTNYSVNHIKLALWADIMVIAPATANTIAKAANGIADNLLTSIILASRSPVLFAPSMDLDMYDSDITRSNLNKIRGVLNYYVIEPESGPLASGLSGKGRLPEITQIIDEIDKILNYKRDLSGKKILITAGPTREPIDPVRFLSNKSSGKMGFALAKAAVNRGAEVTLIAGPVNLITPINVNRINVTTSDEMFEAVKQNSENKEIIIMSAAIADFKPEKVYPNKIKKNSDLNQNLELIKTIDILKYLGENKKKNMLVGFAVETDNELIYAKEKLKSKNLDMIVVNNPLHEGAGFDVDTNIVTIIKNDGKETHLEKLPKIEVANKILDEIKTIF
jgi:phosphopantothenoylcysteine decarboxylase / phosphopantothenate---cysteine ligase